MRIFDAPDGTTTGAEAKGKPTLRFGRWRQSAMLMAWVTPSERRNGHVGCSWAMYRPAAQKIAHHDPVSVTLADRNLITGIDHPPRVGGGCA